jgi:cysteine desulfurase family protein (TIGR01976 family)
VTSSPQGAAFDVAQVRSHFPSLVHGAAHFDGPGGSQTPDVVGQAMYDTITGPLANRGSWTVAERNADRAVLDCRTAVADLLCADPTGIVFGRSMTQNTFDMSRAIAKSWKPGDEVVVTRLDHDANIRPWVIAAASAGAEVRFADFDPDTGELDPTQVDKVLSPRTKVVAVTAASNLIGTMPDLKTISEAVHNVGAWLYVDGVHYAAHELVDVEALGADFFGCSPYKFMGPHCGVLYGRPELLEQVSPDKLLPSPDVVPEKFELGTLPYELMAGTTAAISFLSEMVRSEGTRRQRLDTAMGAMQAHEDRLRGRLEAILSALPDVTVHSRAARRTPTLLASFAGHDEHDLRRFLAERSVNAPAGSFYAYEASCRLGLGESGGLRIGLAPYNNDDDVDRLAEALQEYFATPAR